MKTFGDNNAKDRDVTFMLKDAPNWRLDAKASLDSRTAGRKLAKARAKAFFKCRWSTRCRNGWITGSCTPRTLHDPRRAASRDSESRWH